MLDMLEEANNSFSKGRSRSLAAGGNGVMHTYFYLYVDGSTRLRRNPPTN